MYFVYKLMVVILIILHLLLHSSSTITLIERNKTTIGIGGDTINPTTSAENSNNTNDNVNVGNNNNNNSSSSNGDSSDNEFTTPSPNNGLLSLMLLINGSNNTRTDSNRDNQFDNEAPNIGGEDAAADNDVASNTAGGNNQRQRNVNNPAAAVAAPKPTNSKPIQIINSKQIVNASDYLYYNVLHGDSTIEANNESSRSTTSTSVPAYIPERVTNFSSSSTSYPKDTTEATSQQHMFSNSDIEQFLLKYKSSAANKCLMDDIRDVFLWWSFPNGSLRMENLQRKSRYNYLDLSYQNITDDQNLYARTKMRSILIAHNIVAFSAAYNNLTYAPYKTLTLMSSTLKYLTLRGNQFAAYTTNKQKDVISHFLNDTSWYSDSFEQYTDTEHIDSTIHELYPNYRNFEEDKIDPTMSNNHVEAIYKLLRLYKKEEGIAWATFPHMPALLELDISNCYIEFVTSEAFANLTNLQRLFISHNKMLTIPHDTFLNVPRLQYLDLSFTSAFDFDYHIPLPTLEAIINLIYGVKIQPTTFKLLPDLMFLDMSHTKITRNSAMAFTHLGEKLKYLSLCYTAFPMVGNALFKNTALVGLDLSGNPYAAYNMIEDAFESVGDTLLYLYFEQSNLKDLSWLKYLVNLRVLGLAGNNINTVSVDTFGPLKSLQVLDLSSNHVGNWYNSAFSNNNDLKVLNLRENNINIINPEMLKDFQLLDYLSLGDNNFVCHCLLRDIVNIAAANNQKAECSRNVLQDVQQLLTTNFKLVSGYLSPNASRLLQHGYNKVQGALNATAEHEQTEIARTLLNRYRPRLEQSYENLRRYNLAQHRVKMRFMSRFYNALREDPSGGSVQCSQSHQVYSERLNDSSFKFQLLDYEDEHYWCFNETERLHFLELDCQARSYVDNLAKQLNALTKYVVGSVCTVLGLTLLGVVLYLKRWHIHYYYSSLKSAALVAVASKESVNRFNELAEHDPNLVYDIFISYCQNDREWVLEELLPNVEESGNISICLHERDFQIGVTIFDNIISCMDRSRALMLIISSDFLLSHWCQFEMHLAQHRIFEVSKEHLIIVFLEDIPRSKRPKTLQYLMEVKTYIKWPGAKSKKPVRPEERKLFWKRLKRSLEQIGVLTESHA